MRSGIGIGAAVILVSSFIPALAQEAARPISWRELHNAGRLKTGEVIDQDGPHRDPLRVSSQISASMTLVELDNPGITTDYYEVTGQIRYENVDQTGFLEMWSLFPGGGRYFSRTLAASGPMASLSGTSPWRDFTLPFSLAGAPAGTKPNKLVVNVVLPAGGTVYLSPMRLMQPTSGRWWSDSTGGFLGSIAGGLFGLIGALVGVLTSLRRGRAVVLTLLGGSVLLGVFSLIGGIVALVARQPYGVWYPLLLLGSLLTVVAGSLFPVVRKRFAISELQRMNALDAR
jgi:hypothetical protein